jgi:uncharacterized membrane protein YkvA (DUF1232 family)
MLAVFIKYQGLLKFKLTTYNPFFDATKYIFLMFKRQISIHPNHYSYQFMIQSESLIVKILKSVFFQKATGKAGKTIKNAGTLVQLLRDVAAKSGGMKAGQEGFRDKISLLVRMVKAYASGEYKAIPWKTITRIVAVLIYFISPIDIIPDFLLGIGLTDDLALVMWLIGAIAEDIEAFNVWEKREKTIVIG